MAIYFFQSVTVILEDVLQKSNAARERKCLSQSAEKSKAENWFLFMHYSER